MRPRRRPPPAWTPAFADRWGQSALFWESAGGGVSTVFIYPCGHLCGHLHALSERCCTCRRGLDPEECCGICLRRSR